MSADSREHRQSLELIAFIRENQERFYRMAYSYVKNQETALDLVQDAIVQALQKRHTLREPEHMKSWFYRILINECLACLRREKCRQRFLFRWEPGGEENGLQQGAAELSRDTSMDLYAALEQLSPEMKTVILLRFFEDMKLEEMAEVLGVNVNTVKSRLYRALRLLKADLEVE